MSAAGGWDLTVPEDAAELMEQLRRRGILPGQRLHIGPVSRGAESVERWVSWPRRLSFAGVIQAGSDLPENTDRYLDCFGR